MKKGLILLLCAFMLITVATPVSAAAFPDTARKSCETAVEVLSALSIVEGKGEAGYEPDSQLTRAEMAAIMLRAMNTAVAPGADIFKDVPASHWAYGNITAAYQTGIVNGMDKDTFEPDASVTYEQAIKMVVAVLGYTVQAEYMGGYPAGYMAKAAQLGLLSGMTQENTMTRGNMAILLYNALDAELFLRTAWGTEASYTDTSGKTLLSQYHKVLHLTNKITASAMAELITPAVKPSADEAVLENGMVLKAGSSKIPDMVGVRAEIYARTEDGDDIPTVLTAFPAKNVKVITVPADKIDASSTKSLFVYTNEEGREIKENISGVKLVYNGKAKDPWTEADLLPDIGTVRLVSNGGATYEAIFADEYVNAMVSSVDVGKDKVYFKDKIKIGSREYYDMTLENSGKKASLSMQDNMGVAITPGDVHKADILSIAESEDGTIRKIRNCYDTVSGQIEEFSGDTVKINDEVYPVDKALLAKGKLSAGQSALYYLDFLGNIASVDTATDASFMYGWLVGAAKGKGIGGRPQLKIFTEKGEMQVFDLAEKVELDGTVSLADVLIDDGAANAIWNGAAIPQLLRLRTNADGTSIRVIETAENKTRKDISDEDKLGGSFSMDYFINKDRNATEYNGTPAGGQSVGLGNDQQYVAGIALGKVGVLERTKFFCIPSNTERDEDYRIIPKKEITLEGYRNYKCLSFYDVNETYACSAMVVHNYLTGSGRITTYPGHEDAAFGIVTKVSLGISEDGMEVRNITITGDKTLSTTIENDFECLYKAANADVEADMAWYTDIADDGTRIRGKIGTARPEMFMQAEALEPGDVVFYSADTLGKLSLVSVIYRVSYPGEVSVCDDRGRILPTLAGNYYRGGVLEMCATVRDKTECGLLVDVNLADGGGKKTGSTVAYTVPVGGRIVVWDTKKEILQPIAGDEITVGDKFFYAWKTNSPKFLVVYR